MNGDLWWSGSGADIRGAAPDLRNAALPVAIGLAVTMIVFLVLQTVLVAMALGSGDFVAGQPGGVSAGRLRIYSFGVVVISTAIGAWLTARRARAADIEEAGARRVTPFATGPVALGIAVNGLTGGAGVTGPLLVIVCAAVGTALGAWWGTR